jgi:hypothetical protein
LRLTIKTDGRVLLATNKALETLPILRTRLGLTGQILVIEPKAETLTNVSDDDCAVVNDCVFLKAQASQIPLRNGGVETVLCWSSFMDFDNKRQTAGEFFRVLAAGGRVIIGQQGPKTPLGKPRPCRFGLKNIFLEAGFNSIDLKENEELFLFTADKVTSFFSSKWARA